jgi:hypothetical protein
MLKFKVLQSIAGISWPRLWAIRKYTYISQKKYQCKNRPGPTKPAQGEHNFFWGYNADKKCVLLSGEQAGLRFAGWEKAKKSVKKYADFFGRNYENDTISTRCGLEGHWKMTEDANYWGWCPQAECRTFSPVITQA